MRQIVFDLETTGFKFSEGHRIVEIGAVELIRGAITGRTFHSYVNPDRDMPVEAFRVHGISAAFLKDKPRFADPIAGPAFTAFVSDSELIAHNGIGFDLPFLNAELSAAGLGPLENAIKDTMLMARRKFPGAPASLDALCARFGIDTNERSREGHGALLDSRLLAAVYIELTGGVQAGLDFADANGRAAARGDAKIRAKLRPAPLPQRVTPDEAAAHAAFIAELGPESLWMKNSKP